jgi:ferredoxin-NADP reductase
LANKRLAMTPKHYRLARFEYTTPRVKYLTFELDEPITIKRPEFNIFAFAQIEFGPEISRSYSIVSGDLNSFSLGVALDDHSRGGSAYIHNELKVGDRITMAPGGSPKAIEDEEKCIKEGLVKKRMVIIGGIGVTSFLPEVKH